MEAGTVPSLQYCLINITDSIEHGFFFSLKKDVLILKSSGKCGIGCLKIASIVNSIHNSWKTDGENPYIRTHCKEKPV